MTWTLGRSQFPLAARCLNVRPELAALAHTVGARCEETVSDSWARISSSANRRRRDNYLFRFVLPVAELAGWPDAPVDRLDSVLAAGLMWCFAWRALDDVLDEPKPDASAVGAAFSAFSDALALTLGCLKNPSPGQIRRMTSMHTASCALVEDERKGCIGITSAWKRSSQFFVVPSMVLRLPKRRLALYRNYVNTVALTHDIHDLLSDIRQGTVTPPVRWMSDVDPDFPFRPSTVRAWFDRAAKELAVEVRKCKRDASPEFRILTVMIGDAEDVLRELRESV